MEAGFSRMNDVTVLQASQGLAKYVAKNVKNSAERGVVVGHDHRFNSARFAELTALAFVQLGFKVYQFGLIHTPLVPFAVDQLKAACGVMVTASHNPADDNGYKVYWENGCQIIPPHDSGISASIDENLQPWSWDVKLLDNENVDNATKVGVQEAYYRALKDKLNFENVRKDDKLRLVYTPMHGVGLPSFMRAVEVLGLSKDWVVVVEEQATPDPTFPTVEFPNPEEKGALDLAMKTADEHGVELILANDPDADRFVAAVKHEGIWTQLTGNQIGSLFGEFIVSRYQGDMRNLALLNSTVSSEFNKHLASMLGFKWEDTLTGFKWIGNRAIELEAEGYTVPFAYEEALGYMFPVVHDKDGISAAYVFVQMAADWNRRGTNGYKRMEELYSKIGYFAEVNSYYISNDPSVTDSVFALIRSLDHPYPKTVGPFKVERWRDLTVGYDSSTPDNYPFLPVSSSVQMITVTLSNENPDEGVVFTARGSGTEPKLKVYIEAHASSESRAKTLSQSVWCELRNHWFKPSESGLKER
jgi:phosphoglucomutase